MGGDNGYPSCFPHKLPGYIINTLVTMSVSSLNTWLHFLAFKFNSTRFGLKMSLGRGRVFHCHILITSKCFELSHNCYYITDPQTGCSLGHECVSSEMKDIWKIEVFFIQCTCTCTFQLYIRICENE